MNTRKLVLALATAATVASPALAAQVAAKPHATLAACQAIESEFHRRDAMYGDRPFAVEAHRQYQRGVDACAAGHYDAGVSALMQALDWGAPQDHSHANLADD